ncbi:MAG TPA: hypothetical protein VER08_10860 [Pyrinomonadaceae bacterium]|nr:hypothetical protein [Pyrinomonadaceae bacterium]
MPETRGELLRGGQTESGAAGEDEERRRRARTTNAGLEMSDERGS